MLRLRTFLISLLVISAACGEKSTNTATPAEETIAVNVDAIPGIYSAIMPCEGCQSRRMLLTLRPDHSATQTDIRIREGNPESNINDCQWQWNNQSHRIEIRNEPNVKLDLEFQSDSALLMSVGNETSAIVFRKQKSILKKELEVTPLTPEQMQQQLRERSADVHVKASETSSTSGNH
jgi:hypothetical protein